MADSKNEDRDKTEIEIFAIAGLKFPYLRLFRPENFKEAFNLRPYAKDVIICSFPKSDSKIIDIMVWKLLYPSLPLPPLDSVTNRYLPPIEISGIPDKLKQGESPRLYKTYLPFHYVSLYKRAKYIYVVRTPWQACVSYYKLLRLNSEFTISFDEYFQLFLKGEVGYGSYFKHILSWAKRYDDSNVLVLYHDQLKQNPRSVMSIIATFLGESYLNKLLYSDDLQNDILKCMDWPKYCSPKKSVENSSTSDKYFTVEKLCSSSQLEELALRMTKETRGTPYEPLWGRLLKQQNIIIES